MLQLFFAVAFTAAPLTLYLPPIRRLTLFVSKLEESLHYTNLYTLQLYPRIRFAFSRTLNTITRFLRNKLKTRGNLHCPTMEDQIVNGTSYSPFIRTLLKRSKPTN